jgi:hypothetical protein
MISKEMLETELSKGWPSVNPQTNHGLSSTLRVTPSDLPTLRTRRRSTNHNNGSAVHHLTCIHARPQTAVTTL